MAMNKVIRRCYVLNEVEVPMNTIKAGDIFRMSKASSSDPIDEDQWMFADEDANINQDFDDQVAVKATPIMFVGRPFHYKAPCNRHNKNIQDLKDQPLENECGAV